MHRVRCLTSHAHIAGHAEEGTKRMRHIVTSTEDSLTATTGGGASDAAYRRLHVLNQSTLHLPDSSPAPYKLTASCH
jgi:hypothetical protein